MDARTARLVQQIDSYLDRPPHGAPDELLSNIQNLKEMLTAPIYSGESPGEQAAREAAKATMPEDVYQKMYENEDNAPDTEVGEFGNTQAASV